MLRVGILGMGAMGREHARAWSRIPGAVLAGAHDPLAGPGEWPGPAAPVRLFKEARELVESREVDVLDICAPPGEHLSLVLLACRAGKPVFCEKPLARDLASALAIRHAAREAGLPLMVGQVLRYFPAYAEARRTVESGILGKARSARLARLVPRPRADWYFDFEKSGGCLLDTGIHDLDFLRWTFGNPLAVSCRAGGPSELARGRDWARAGLDFGGGFRAELEVAWADQEGIATRLELEGDRARLACLSGPAALEIRFADGRVERRDLPGEDPFELELADFKRALESGEEMPVGIEEGLASLRLALDCLRAAGTA